MRVQYSKGSLDEKQVDKNPLLQLDLWLSDAITANVQEPLAMVLSTSGNDHRSSSRVVLMKGLDERGIAFFTNYESRKGEQLKENPFASLLFFWPGLERQVRIEGTVIKVSGEESDAYFGSRPEASRVSAQLSPQSREIPDREWLESRRRKDDGRQRTETNHRSSIIIRPSYWGGYRLQPEYVEFWQGREDRLHDRIGYSRDSSGWRIFRLAP